MVAIPLDWLSRIARPIVFVLGAINRLVLRLLGIRDGDRNAVSEEEIRMLVSEGHAQGVIDVDERNMVNRVLRLGDRTADSLMTPRKRIVWLDQSRELRGKHRDHARVAVLALPGVSRQRPGRGRRARSEIAAATASPNIRRRSSAACASRCSCPSPPMR